MRRREFITLLGSATAWPIAARAQQPAIPVIGFLGASSPNLIANHLRAFHQGLSETDHIEGRNVAIEYRWAEGHNDRLPALAADLVRRQVNVITTPGSTPAALAAKAATGTIPIVFESGADPVAVGLVGSLNRPGSNATGVVSMNVELGPKRLELLHEVVPRATTMAVLINPTNPNGETLLRELQEPARSLGLQLHALRANTEHDFETIFTTLRQLRAGGLVIAADIFFTNQSEQIAALALRHAVPTVYQNREFPAAGGLMSYGGSIIDLYRQVGVYTGRILKGEKPADMPVQQSTKVELIINLKTAKALGLTVPLLLLGRADEVIE
jgi:putative ABC transport system substrate-binding protein